MPDYAIIGSKGAGKSLICCWRIQTYLLAGKRVATNMNVFPENILPPRRRNGFELIRIKDYFDIEDLNAIGRGHYIPDPKRPGHYSKEEKHNGLLVIEEAGVLFNSRDWQDKRRGAVIAWLRHSRKLGWDVLYNMQDLDSCDKQLRKGLMEHVGYCKRLDRFRIPFVGAILDYFGLPSKVPRIHACVVKYGTDPHAPIVDRWTYRGIEIQNGYDTNQVYSEFDLHDPHSFGIHSVLSPWHLKGRFLQPTVLQRLRSWLKGEHVQRPENTPKHPLVAKIMALPPHRRMEFMHRFQQCGAFDPPLVRLSRSMHRELAGFA